MDVPMAQLFEQDAANIQFVVSKMGNSWACVIGFPLAETSQQYFAGVTSVEHKQLKSFQNTK